MVVWARLGSVVLALRIEEGGPEPRNMSSLKRLEKVRKYIILWSLHKEYSPADLAFSMMRSIWTFSVMRSIWTYSAMRSIWTSDLQKFR